MTITTVVSLIRESVYYIVLISSPVLFVAIFVGLIISIFQAVTSIQEQTLTFVPKMIVILLMLFMFGPWMLDSLRGYTLELFDRIGKF